MPLRRHQAEVLDISRDPSIHTIIANVCPGGGKSLLPLLMAQDGGTPVYWLVPRKSLQLQAEESFVDPTWRTTLGHNMTIRAAGNEADPARGHAGYVATYQAVAENPALHIAEMKRRPGLLVLDECHHLTVGSPWSQPVLELAYNARRLLLMSGTLETGSGSGRRVEFLRYTKRGELDMSPQPGVAMVHYGRYEALANGDILDLSLEFVEAHAKWARDGHAEEMDSFSNSSIVKARRALFTALQTEFATHLLEMSMADWRLRRVLDPTALLMVVAPNIKRAREYHNIISSTGLSVDIATSDEGPAAQRAIKAFKSGTLEALVTVAMAYEGLDIPAVTHLACLTQIRSTPWIYQMLSRATRINRRANTDVQHLPAQVFAPRDPMLVRVWEKIQEEAAPLAAAELEEGTGTGGGGGGGASTLEPLSSGAMGYRPRATSVAVEAPSDSEARLRASINSIVRKYCNVKAVGFKTVFGEMKRKFGKGLPDMRDRELETAERWCRTTLAV